MPDWDGLLLLRVNFRDTLALVWVCLLLTLAGAAGDATPVWNVAAPCGRDEWGRMMWLPSLDVEAAPRNLEGLRETCHDMRQPIASVFALAAAALAEPGLPAAARVRLEQIVDQAEWLADLIQHSLQTVEPGLPDSRLADLVRVTSEAVGAERVTWAGKIRMGSPAEPVCADITVPAAVRKASGLRTAGSSQAGATREG